MHVWNVASCKEERDTLYSVDPLLSAGNLLPQGGDLAREITWQIIEMGEMVARNNLNVAATNWIDIEEGQQSIAFKNGAWSNPTLSHLAKKTLRRALWSHDRVS